MIGQIEKNKCTGCKMCADICPKDAISYECDNEGFWYPVVDDEKCTKCGLCTKKCPSLKYEKPNVYEEPNVYAVWSKNKDTRISSTSGGAFWEFADYIIKQGGAVAGSTYNADWKSASHMIAYDTEGLYKLKGSKYFQSDTSEIYQAVKKEVEKGRLFLFCGTPCQNAALRSFLGKEYENLYYMDFICRSINSPLAFKEYITELEQEHGSKASYVHSKNKEYGWQSLASQVKFENGDEIINDRNHDWWVKGFISYDLYTRESCYHCQYRLLPRVTADISIGDFWGITNQSPSDMFRGISVVLLNSEKGQYIFNNVRNNFTVQKHTLDEVLPGNPALLRDPVRTPKQDKFFSLIKEHPFSYCVRKCTKLPIWKRVKKLITKISYKRKRFLRIFRRGNVSFSKYIYYNYFCKHIVRAENCKVIPHKRAILNFDKNSKIYLKGGNLEIGYNQLKGSKSETHIRLDKDAVWNCNNGAVLYYNTVLEIKPNAVFDTGYFSANGGSVIVVHKHITFGEDVMIGRNVIIYDSDFHSILYHDGIINYPQEVIIEDHVWLTSNINVLKGVTIGRDSLITAQSVINKNIPEESIVASGKISHSQVSWSRQPCPVNRPSNE